MLVTAAIACRSFSNDMGLSDLVQKAFYLGVGLASYASEKATDRLTDLRSQAQKLVEEMVDRGEMTTEEAKRLVDELVSQAQKPVTTSSEPQPQSQAPRRIEILTDTESGPEADTDKLRRQVQELQEQLRQLRQD
jgi:polyhydroxyalkanoate synthesis regulator phasin